MFDRNTPFNDLPPLPPTAELESKAILKKTIAASRALAELKGMAERMPNQAMLIDSLVLQEARASSEIENILTTNDELFKAASDEALPASAEAKEVLRYRQALHHGFRQIKERPLATGLFIEVAQLIKQTDFNVRRVAGTRIANSRGETIYSPPEGEGVIRDKLRELENFMHAEDGLDVLTGEDGLVPTTSSRPSTPLRMCVRRPERKLATCNSMGGSSPDQSLWCE